MKKFPLIYWLPVLLYYAFITYLSGTSPPVPGEAWVVPNLDKIYHFVEYAFLGFMLARDLFWEKIFLREKRDWRPVFLVFLVVLVFLDELHQSYTPTRYMEVWDAVVDVVAAFCGAGVFLRSVKGGSTATPQELKLLKERDERYFGLLLPVLLFFIVLSINVLSLKFAAESRIPMMGPYFAFIEWASLGYVTYRALYLSRGKRHLNWNWTALIPLGFAVMAGAFVGIHVLIHVANFSSGAVPQLGLFYACGVFIKFAKIRFDVLHQRMREDPAFERNSWQRVYYFYLAIMMAMLVLSLSLLSPRDAGILVPDEEGPAIAFFFVLYFVFGVVLFRGAFWEAWWHGERGRKLILIVAAVLAIAVVSTGEALKTSAGGWPMTPIPAFVNLSAVLLAYFVYGVGFRMALSGESKPDRRPFYLKRPARSGAVPDSSQEGECCGLGRED